MVLQKQNLKKTLRRLFCCSIAYDYCEDIYVDEDLNSIQAPQLPIIASKKNFKRFICCSIADDYCENLYPDSEAMAQ